MIRTFVLLRTLPKYLTTFLHENAVLTIGLTDQSGYSICLLYGQTFYPYSTVEKKLHHYRAISGCFAIVQKMWSKIGILDLILAIVSCSPNWYATIGNIHESLHG